MKLSLFGRMALALIASVALGLGMTACGGGTIAYLWVVGSQYNQIAGFKVDDYTGNLTQIPRSPFSVSGGNPVSILIRPGGRYLYVLNQGTGGGPGTKGSSSGISVFSVGGDGTLTYQVGYQSQGFVPVWMQFDGTGSYLYVLDKYSPNYGVNGDVNGSITAFSVDPNTGRLTLVGNSQTQVGQLNTYFFEVGQNPLMMKTAGSCLFTVNSGNQSITSYGINGSNGQLTIGTTQTITTSATNITSINGNGQFLVLTDSGSNIIFPYTVSGTSCTLSTLTGGNIQPTNGTRTPVYSLFDNSGKYLYILNQGTTAPTTTSSSSISAYTLNTTSASFTEIVGSPYTVGSGPVCMVEDTTNQYIYVSNHNDGTVTGKVIDSTTGRLSDLTRGATFQATGQAGCLVLSGNVQ